MGGTFFSGLDSGQEWRCPMGFIDDLKGLLSRVENQSTLERDSKIPQSTISRIVNDFKENKGGNPTLKNLAPIIDLYGFRLVDPTKQKLVSEDEVRDKIANEVMKGLLSAGHGDVAATVFAIITKTNVNAQVQAQSSSCGRQAVGG